MNVLIEVLEKCYTFADANLDTLPADGYFIYEEKINDELCGFVVFGKTPLTQSNWDIYWVVVDKKYQGKGIGSRLIRAVEAYILEKDGFATMRLETSSRKEYVGTRIFYVKNGFKESGRIPGFYALGDDLVTFYKKVEPEMNKIIDRQIEINAN
jgi:ribosomal protein S18 acetylase RimI-like enzyme